MNTQVQPQEELARAEALVRALREELAASNHGLLALTSELEDRVAERTAELQAANESLEQSRVSALKMRDDAIAANERLTRANTALSASEERFRKVWEGAIDGKLLTDSDGRVVSVNAAFCRIVGRKREEIEGHALASLFAEPEGGEIPTHCREMFEKKVPVGRLECQVTLWNDKEIWLDVSLSFLEAEPGRPLLLGILRDVTERRQVQQQMLRTQRLESIGTLAGGVAHDLNNALAPILMATDLLLLEYPDEQRLIDTIATSARHGADMVRQLLTFAKGVEGERLLIKPHHLLKEMEKIIKTTFPKRIEFHSKYTKELDAIVGDATQLHQVLLNLCVNARDAMDEGGTLTLEAENVDVDASYASSIVDAKPGRYVVWRITDTGMGIPHDNLERIFEPFFSTKGPDKGTGLGLSTVSGIVRSHSGFIRVYSVMGKGTTFSVYLPSQGAAANDVDVDAPDEESFRGNGETILVVDDELNVRTITSKVLSNLNFNVITAVDGMDALAMVMDHRDNLRAVVTDLHMPNMDGVTFSKTLKRLLPAVGLIVATGRLEETELEGIAADACLQKPFTQEVLVNALRKIFAKEAAGQ